MTRLSRALPLSIALGAALYLAIAFAAGAREVGRELDAFAWPMAAGALGLAATNYGLRFLKWQYYLGRLGLRVPLGRSLATFLAGFSLTVTPGKLGEVLKSWLLRESDGVPMARSAPIVVAERVTDLVACLALVVVGIGWAEPTPGVLAAAGAGGALTLVLLLAVGSDRVADLGLGLLGRLSPFARLVPKLREFHAATRTLLSPGPLLVATAVSVLAWEAECAAFAVVLRGLSGPRVSLGLATFIYAATTVAGAVSFLPGGLGVQEGGMIGLLAATAGVARGEAVAATFITRVCTLWFAVLVGVVALLVVRRRTPLDLAALERRERTAAATPDGDR